MKKLLSLLLVAFIFCPVSFADSQTPQDEIKSLKAALEEQRTLITTLRQWARDLDIRMKMLEDMKEVRVPRGIKNNLRILQSAVEQYCFEHKVIECKFSDLMGKYLKPATFSVYDGESYESLRLALDAGEWRIDTTLGFSVVHKLPAFDAKEYEKLIGGKPNKSSTAQRP